MNQIEQRSTLRGDGLSALQAILQSLSVIITLSPHGWVVVRGSYTSLTRASTDLCGQAQIGRRNGQQIGREVCSLLFPEYVFFALLELAGSSRRAATMLRMCSCVGSCRWRGRRNMAASKSPSVKMLESEGGLFQPDFLTERDESDEVSFAALSAVREMQGSGRWGEVC